MAGNVKKGSITIFLALILSLVLSLVCASIESVRMAAARTQILNSMDIGLYSLFGQYDRTLLEDYELFALYAGGKEELDMASVYDDFQTYMKPVLKQNSQKLELLQGGFNGYQLLSDGKGEIFYQQAVQYMRETLGSQGVQTLLGKLKDQEKKTEDAEKKGEQAENKGTLDSYDSAITDAAQKSEEAKKEQEQQKNQGDFSDAGNGDDFTGGVDESVENPIPIIRRVRKMGLLDLVVPSERGISDAVTDRKSLTSGRKLQTGLMLDTDIRSDNSYTSGILFGQYLLSDGGKRIQVETLALAIASGFLIPPAAAVIEAALIFCWAFAESILDVRELFAGGHVPLIKNSSDWQLSLSNLPNILDKLDSSRKNAGNGMSYEDYLKVLLMAKGKQDKVLRGMDMIECSVREKGKRPGFQMDHCITALEASADVKANRRKIFTVTRQYAYE